jgi:ice-binding like protein/PEP-CTERM motif-containing protein
VLAKKFAYVCDSAQREVGAKGKIEFAVMRRPIATKGHAMNAPKYLLPFTFSVLGTFCGPSQGLAAPILGSADPYAILGATLVSASGDGANIIGGVGSPTSVTGPMVITGGTLNNAGASAALGDANAAAKFLGGLSGKDLTGTDLGGLTLDAGVYTFATTAALNGTLTLDAQNNNNAVFIFDIGTALTTGSNAKVSVINGGPNDGVYWLIGSQATLGNSTVFEGNIIARTDVVLDPSAQIQCGRAIANAAVTMAGATATNPTNLVSINGVPAGCAGGFGGGYTVSQDSNGNSSFALIDSGGFVGISEGEGVSPPGGPVSGGGLVSAVPEPPTLALLGIAFVGLGIGRHRATRSRHVGKGDQISGSG